MFINPEKSNSIALSRVFCTQSTLVIVRFAIKATPHTTGILCTIVFLTKKAMFRSKSKNEEGGAKYDRKGEEENVAKETKREREDEDADNEIHQQQVEAAQLFAVGYKTNLLKDQRERERKASEAGHFMKHQRIRYHHKASDEWLDGHVVAVHYDDGPDKPYYTISYVFRDCDGSVEKQTTEDRIKPLDFDDEVTWAI